MKKSFFVLVLSIAMSTFPLTSVEAAPKKGDRCVKVGQNSGKGNNRLTCAPVTKLRWVANPKIPVIGSIFSPAQMGKVVEVGNLDVRVTSIDFQIGEEICATNSWNEGCRINRFKGEVDPDSDIRWIGVEVDVENGFVGTVELSSTNYIFYLVTPDNTLIDNYNVAVFNNNLADLTLKEGERGKGKVVFAVPKTVSELSSLLLIRDQSRRTPKDYYFLLDW